jgi:short subunit dehydrogenase-like uncharacterized protein
MSEHGVGDREFDVILWGATGFTGRLVAEYLAGRYGGELRWALAGRNRGKLEAVRDGLGPAASGLPVLLADGDDLDSLDALAARTRVICTTVGPYALHGSGLVAACVGRGTHYCDLTGEVHWMRRMIDLHHDAARASGARIVHTCGFDSIPSDLGVYCLQREMQRRHGVSCAAVKFRAREFRGGFSGGTVASMLNMLDEAERDPEIVRVLEDPYGLNPAAERRGLDGPERTLPEYDRDFAGWVTPFVMGVINTKVVRRTNALLGYAYGHEFRYDEGTLMPFGAFGFPLAAAMSAGSAAFTAAASVRALRKWLASLLPKPGEGPSAETRASGFYVIELLGRHPTDRQRDLRLRIRGDRDPGYGSTSKMLAESAVCLARDPLATPGGVLTPAAAMGDALLARLTANAGVSFELF